MKWKDRENSWKENPLRVQRGAGCALRYRPTFRTFAIALCMRTTAQDLGLRYWHRELESDLEV